MNDKDICTHALIDCGAIGIALMDHHFPHHCQIQLEELKETCQVEVIVGRFIESVDNTHSVTVGVIIQDHNEQLPMLVTILGHYTILLGIPLQRLYNTAVQFMSNTVMLGSQYFTTHCHNTRITVQAVTEQPPQQVRHQGKWLFEPQIRPEQSFWENIVMLNECSLFLRVKRGKLTIFQGSLCDINNAIEANDLKEWPLEELIPK